jgi:hypothetical protein
MNPILKRSSDGSTLVPSVSSALVSVPAASFARASFSEPLGIELETPRPTESEGPLPCQAQTRNPHPQDADPRVDEPYRPSSIQ